MDCLTHKHGKKYKHGKRGGRRGTSASAQLLGSFIDCFTYSGEPSVP